MTINASDEDKNDVHWGRGGQWHEIEPVIEGIACSVYEHARINTTARSHISVEENVTNPLDMYCRFSANNILTLILIALSDSPLV